MNKEKLKRLLNTAGKNFFILHIEDIMASGLSDPDTKTRKINQYYADQHGFCSKDRYGIRVRINAVLQIIAADAVADALELINIEDSRILPEAREKVLELRKG